MKKIWAVIVIIFSVILIIPACAFRKSEPITQKHFIPENERIANGEKVYMRFCQQCHPAGEAGLAPSLNSNPLPQFLKRFQVRHGLGAMPSFKKNVISRSDLHDLSKYMRAWKKYS